MGRPHAGSNMAGKKETYDSYVVPLAIPCVYYIPDFVEENLANEWYSELHSKVPWQKTAKINRWVCLYEDSPNNDYKYRDAPEGGSLAFNDTINRIKEEVEALYSRLTGRAITFNTCLCNFYQDGNQRIGWHADREEIGRSTPIASISLGAVRQFQVRHKVNGVHDRATIDLASGSVVFMENVCQREYLHAVPKQTDVTQGRINLTFRCKTEETRGEEEHEKRDHWLEDLANQDLPYDNHHLLLHTETGTVPMFGDDVPIGFATDVTPNVRYTVSCNIGTEGAVAAEVMERLPGWQAVASPFGVRGYVAVCSEAPDESIVSTLLQLRSALHVMKYHDHFTLADVAATSDDDVAISKIDGELLYRFYKQRLQSNPHLVETLAVASSDQPRTFRVTCDRIGAHAFQAPTVEFEIGGALSEFYTACKPKMTDYDVHCRVDVVGDQVIVGTQLNVEDLSKRHFLRYRNAVTLKTNLAFVMLKYANLQKNSLLIDPFCGSGTVLLEALEMTDKNIKCIGLDVSKRSAQGAGENAQAAGYSTSLCSFHTCDARGIRKHVKDESADAICTNLPWGVRTGHKQGVADLQQTYEVFLRSAWYTLKPGGRIVMLVLRGLQMIRILRKLGGRYRILSVKIVRTTNNLPAIIVVEKLATDTLRDILKGQLAQLSAFVNVSTEMYRAINYEDIDEAN